MLNNGTQSPAEKLNVSRLKKPKYCLSYKAWANIFAETKINAEKEIYKYILGKEVLSRKREREGDFKNVVVDLH